MQNEITMHTDPRGILIDAVAILLDRAEKDQDSKLRNFALNLAAVRDQHFPPTQEEMERSALLDELCEEIV